MRVNNGLHTLEQLPYIRQLIRIEEVRGNPVAAWELEQDLLALVKRYPADLRTVEVFRGVADRRMDLMRRYLASERPPEVYLGCYYGGGCDAGSRKGVARSILADAQLNYWSAITVMLRNEQYSSDELCELELDVLRGTDFVRTMYGDHPHAYVAAYNRGRQSLRRLYGYGAARNAPPLQQVDALVQMRIGSFCTPGMAARSTSTSSPLRYCVARMAPRRPWRLCSCRSCQSCCRHFSQTRSRAMSRKTRRVTSTSRSLLRNTVEAALSRSWAPRTLLGTRGIGS